MRGLSAAMIKSGRVTEGEREETDVSHSHLGRALEGRER